MAKIFEVELACDHDTHMAFIAGLQRRLAVQTGRSVAEKEFMELANYVENQGRQLADPASLVGIACLLGFDHARRVLNPHEDPSNKRTFNTLADVEKIRLTNYIRHTSLGAGHDGDYHLYSFDKGLNALSKIIRVKQTASWQTSNQPPSVRLLAQWPRPGLPHNWTA